jgi:hypothetical protein
MKKATELPWLEIIMKIRMIQVSNHLKLNVLKRKRNEDSNRTSMARNNHEDPHDVSLKSSVTKHIET